MASSHPPVQPQQPPQQHRPSPRKRPHAALPAHAAANDDGDAVASAPAAATATASASALASAPHISQLHRHQLAQVVSALAPTVVLEQHLTVPGAPAGNLSASLADSAPLLPLSVLRACVNEACTSALLSSAMALDGPSEQDSARLLNDVDRFQSAILSVLDQLELAYDRQRSAGGGGEVKLEPEAAALDPTTAPPPPAKIQRYMLHRTLPTGVDVFTSAAVLSDQDLEALSKIEDTDVIAVHPPPSSSTTSTSWAPALPGVPVPSLGRVNPRPVETVVAARQVAPVARVGAAPGLYGPEAALRKDPRFIDPLNPTRRPTVLLRYSSPFVSSLAPTHDSTGATEPYTASASRALSRLRARRWIDASLHPDGGGAPVGPMREEAEKDALVLTEAEAATLRELGVDLEAFLDGAKSNARSRFAGSGSRSGSDSAAAAEGVKRLRTGAPVADAENDEEAVWTALERNAELIVRVARAQVARARESYEAELRLRSRKRAEQQQRGAVRPNPLGGGGGLVALQKGVDNNTEETDGEGLDRAGSAELKDAEALLDSLVALVASLPAKRAGPERGGDLAAVTVGVVPPRAFLSQLAPLLLAARQKEPSFRGMLDPAYDRAIKMRENVLPPAVAPPHPGPRPDSTGATPTMTQGHEYAGIGGLQLGGGGDAPEMDLKVF